MMSDRIFESNDQAAVVVEVIDQRWYDKSSSAYFVSEQTRNAQTISWKQRHRPVFLLFADLFTGILLTGALLFSNIVQLRVTVRGESSGLDALW